MISSYRVLTKLSHNMTIGELLKNSYTEDSKFEVVSISEFKYIKSTPHENLCL